MTYQFPLDVFPPGTFQPWLANTRIGGGSTLNGIGQEADWSGGGFWAFEMTNFRIQSADEHLAWNAIATRCGNGFTEIEVPVVDGYTWPIGDATPDTMSFTAHADANLRATSIDIQVVTGGEIKPGHKFGRDHDTAGKRAYSIFDVEDLGSGLYRCQFRPPLREAILATTALNFRDPSVVMKITSAAKDLWPKIEPPYKGTVTSFAVVESFSYQDGLA